MRLPILASITSLALSSGVATACPPDEEPSTETVHHGGQPIHDAAIFDAGDQYLATWYVGDELHSARLDRAGFLLGDTTLREVPLDATLVIDGDDSYLIGIDAAWHVVAQPLDADGAPAGEPIILDYAEGNAVEAVADDAGITISWHRRWGTAVDHEVVVSRLEGGVATAPVVAGRTNNGGLTLVATGDVDWVLWYPTFSSNVVGARVHRDGTVDPSPVSLGRWDGVPAAASLGGQALLVGVEEIYGDIVTMRLDADGVQERTQLPIPMLIDDAVFAAPDGYRLTGLAGDLGSSVVWRLTPEGTLRDDAPIASLPRAAAIASDGTDLVALSIEQGVEGLDTVDSLRARAISAGGAAQLLVQQRYHDEEVPTCVPIGDFDDVRDSDCSVAGGSSRALILMAALIAILPRRRRR